MHFLLFAALASFSFIACGMPQAPDVTIQGASRTIAVSGSGASPSSSGTVASSSSSSASASATALTSSSPAASASALPGCTTPGTDCISCFLAPTGSNFYQFGVEGQFQNPEAASYADGYGGQLKVNIEQCFLGNLSTLSYSQGIDAQGGSGGPYGRWAAQGDFKGGDDVAKCWTTKLGDAAKSQGLVAPSCGSDPEDWLSGLN